MSTSLPSRRRLRTLAAVLFLAAVLGAVAPQLLLFASRPLLLNLGPNDAEYVSRFREEWERDVRTRFHWTTLHSQVQWPVRLSGEGHVLRARLRRHFVDPAVIRLSAEGRTFAEFEIQADPKVPSDTGVPDQSAPTDPMKSGLFMPSLSRNFCTPPCEIQVRAMVAPSTGVLTR